MEEARVQPAGVAVTKPVLVLGFDDTGQFMVSVLDGNLLRACALLHIAATQLDMMKGIANQGGIVSVTGLPQGPNSRRE